MQSILGLMYEAFRKKDYFYEFYCLNVAKKGWKLVFLSPNKLNTYVSNTVRRISELKTTFIITVLFCSPKILISSQYNEEIVCDYLPV